MKRKFDLGWRGRLTVGNIGDITKLLAELLDGQVFILVTSYGNSAPDITKNVKIDHGQFAFWHDEENGSAGIDIFATEEIGHFVTYLQDGVFDRTRQGPFATFEGDRVTISYRSDAGLYCHWQAVVMEENDFPPKASVKVEKKEMTLEEFLAEIRELDIETLSAGKIKSDFERGLVEIKCAQYPHDDIRLLVQGGRAISFVAGDYRGRKELRHLANIIISDLT